MGSSGIRHVFHAKLFLRCVRLLYKKIEALHAYGSEMRMFPHPRSIEAVEHLARWRGATVGCLAAEAFMLGRIII